MTTRRSFLVGGLTVLAVSSLPSTEQARAEAPLKLAYIRSASAITEVFGDGQRLVGIAIKYDHPVDASVLAIELYTVENRTVTRVYSNAAPIPAAKSVDGIYVIVELSPNDEAARLYKTLPGGGIQRLPAAATINVKLPGAPPPRAPEEKGPPVFGREPLPLPTSGAANLVVDDFMQEEFWDKETGDRLAYNLYIPKDRDPKVALPLVLFLHDAGATNTITNTTLVQGLGAISWSSPEDQSRHPAIVVAPQYAAQIVNDSSEASSFLETTLHLIGFLVTAYNVDRTRIYTTGQSGGGMMSIAMLVKEPELFAAAFLVACQWDPAVVAPLAQQKLWVMVSEGDAKAYPGQNAIMEVIEKHGTKVSRSVWDGNSPPDAFASLVKAQADEGRSVNYSILRRGTVVPSGQDDNPGANHINTWRIAYTIPGIRDWIMAQRRVKT